jgi:hypothetical protein
MSTLLPALNASFGSLELKSHQQSVDIIQCNYRSANLHHNFAISRKLLIQMGRASLAALQTTIGAPENGATCRRNNNAFLITFLFTLAELSGLRSTEKMQKRLECAL